MTDVGFGQVLRSYVTVDDLAEDTEIGNYFPLVADAISWKPEAWRPRATDPDANAQGVCRVQRPRVVDGRRLALLGAWRCKRAISVRQKLS